MFNDSSAVVRLSPPTLQLGRRSQGVTFQVRLDPRVGGVGGAVAGGGVGSVRLSFDDHFSEKNADPSLNTLIYKHCHCGRGQSLRFFDYLPPSHFR